MTQNLEESFYIPLPFARQGEGTKYISSFNDLAQSPAPEAVGHIRDLKRFDRSLGLEDDAKKQELYIKAPGTGFYIPPEYRQFVPEIKQMIDTYYSNHGDNGFCTLAIHQAIIQPDAQNTRPFIGTHKDITLSRINKEGKAPSAYVQIVSNALTTGFSSYKLSETDLDTITTTEDPDKALQDILNQDHVQFKSFDPGIITAFNATSVHALRNPLDPTQRTTLITAFSPEKEALPKEFNNPWLTAAIKAQNTVNMGIKLET